MIAGDPYAMPLLAAMAPIQKVVALSAKNRLESVWITGSVKNGEYGITANGWQDGDGNFQPSENIQISGSFIEEVNTFAFTAYTGSCFQVYNTAMINAGNCRGGTPNGGLMYLRGIDFMDVDQVSMLYGNAVGLRAINVYGFHGTNIEVDRIATPSSSVNECGSPRPAHRGMGMAFDNFVRTAEPTIEIANSYMTDITGVGFSSRSANIDVQFDYIGLSLFAQQNGNAENAVVSSDDASVCIGEAGSTKPFSLLACGQVDVPCQGSIPATQICP